MEAKKIEVKKYISISARLKENYKSLRANIDFCKNVPKVILITSSIPGEGKSTVSLRLANEIAKSRKKVLMMDCDMRKSRWSELFGISRQDKKGVSDFLAGKVSISDALWQTDEPNLYIMLSGTTPPNPAELLGSEAFTKLLNACRQEFDYVLIDAPPMASVIDPAVICSKCDGVLFVIASDMVSCRIVRRALQQIERAGGMILGAVLNKIKFSNRALYGTYGTSKYYYSNYSKYYD
ncbi:CpsD/CapB family tyrosine-protein kinase [Drancourtella sp. An12]|uniref:CpsD/CapB family tyrosine-protein kinase n=1 Tax=Drancourtella sp. An12 TaxID=1965548 RepID=UPI0013A65BEF|nr:CpsD/CapB family tyrosine-protein kinase [Drancourtella sp. An12]